MTYFATAGRTDVGGGPPRAYACGVASINVGRDDPYRRKITFTNDSDTIIYLAKSDQAVLNAGIRLNANGGSLIDEPDTKGYIYTGIWSAITSLANKNLCVQEN